MLWDAFTQGIAKNVQQRTGLQGLNKRTISTWGLMPTLLYARYPAPQIIQAVINILNKLLYPSKISIFQQCCSGKNLIYNLNLLEVVCADYWIFISSLLAPKGRNVSFYCLSFTIISRDVDPFWPLVTPNPDFSTGELFLTAVMVACGENRNWLSNPLYLLICYLGSQMTAHKYMVKKKVEQFHWDLRMQFHML